MSLSCKTFENCGCSFSLFILDISFPLVWNRNTAYFTKELCLNKPVIKPRLTFSILDFHYAGNNKYAICRALFSSLV